MHVLQTSGKGQFLKDVLWWTHMVFIWWCEYVSTLTSVSAFHMSDKPPLRPLLWVHAGNQQAFELPPFYAHPILFLSETKWRGPFPSLICEVLELLEGSQVLDNSNSWSWLWLAGLWPSSHLLLIITHVKATTIHVCLVALLPRVLACQLQFCLWKQTKEHTTHVQNP